MKDQDKLLSDIQNSIMNMQTQMQTTYQDLDKIKVTGESSDGNVTITLTATYAFVGIQFGKDALQGGVEEFKKRIAEAFQNVIKKVQEATQAETMKLLQSMQIPDEIKNMSMPEEQRAIESDDEDN